MHEASNFKINSESKTWSGRKVWPAVVREYTHTGMSSLQSSIDKQFKGMW